MITRIVLYLFALADLTLFYIFYQEWASWIVLMAAVGLPWLALLASLPAMARLRLELEVPPRVKLCGSAWVRLRWDCPLPRPPVRMKLLVKRTTTRESWTLKPGDKLPTDHCGGLVIRSSHPRMYDYLGLFPIPLRHMEQVTAVVMPKKVPLAVPPDLERYLARSWRPKPGGGFGENHELRLYRPGDSLNQVHWKLTAKTGKLMVREPMVPEQGLVLVTMDVTGTPEELDRKFGQLLWLGTYLMERNTSFRIRAMTDRGLESWVVTSRTELEKSVEELLRSGPAVGTVRDHPGGACRCYHIGGESDEA